MDYKIFGNTGLKVSTLCLGTMNYGGKGFFSHMGDLGQKEVDEQIKTAVEAGVNFIDTANIYSEGIWGNREMERCSSRTLPLYLTAILIGILINLISKLDIWE